MTHDLLTLAARAQRDRINNYRVKAVDVGSDYVVLDADVQDIDERFREVYRSSSYTDCWEWVDNQSQRAALLALADELYSSDNYAAGKIVARVLREVAGRS